MYGSAMRCKWIFPIHLPRLEGPATGQDAPGEFVGKCYRQYVVMQPLPGRLDLGLEPVALPDLRLDQHDPRRISSLSARLFEHS
jgi:hypothetical protein